MAASNLPGNVNEGTLSRFSTTVRVEPSGPLADRYDPKHNRLCELSFAAGLEGNVFADEDLLALVSWRKI